jgi:TRAP-type C4-dicarboxylate transport system permease small subunit
MDMVISALFTLIIYALVLGILFWLFDYLVATLPIPDPPARFIRIAIVVVFVLIFIALLLNLVGVSTGVDLPRLR